MKKMKRTSFGRPISCLIMLMIMLMIGQSVMAQGKVTGQVKDSTGLPVSGATISIKNKKASTISGADGNFTIAAAPGDVLTVTFIGYDRSEMRVGTGANLTFTLTSRA